MVSAIKKLAIGGAMALAVSGMVAGMSMTADAASSDWHPSSISTCPHLADPGFSILVDQIGNNDVAGFWYDGATGAYDGYYSESLSFLPSNVAIGNVYHFNYETGEYGFCMTCTLPTYPASIQPCTHLDIPVYSFIPYEVVDGVVGGWAYNGSTGEYYSYARINETLFEGNIIFGAIYHYDIDTSSYGVCSSPIPANAPSLHTMNIGGVTYNTWEQVSEVLPTLEPVLEPVSGRFDDILHVNASGSNRVIPKHVIIALTNSKVKGLHVFIGDGDAITFFRNKDFSAYADTCFDHVDTVTDNSKTVDFTEKKAIGAVVNFHTVTKADAKVTVFKKNADGTETQICVLKADSEGRVCVAINELGTLIFRY